jgi:S1-C subfamily serine protease
MDMNMIVPVSYLRPVLEDLLTTGRVAQAPRPWLGLYAMEGEGGIIVGGVSEKGPAAKAGVQQGDRILALGEEDIPDLGTLWRKLWATGPAGTPITLKLKRDGSPVTVRITSADRTSFLRGPRLH